MRTNTAPKQAHATEMKTERKSKAEKKRTQARMQDTTVNKKQKKRLH